MKRTRKNEVPAVVIELGEKIKEIIEDKELKQREVAHDAGMDVENLRKYIKGSQQMKVSTVFRIAEALGTTASDLLKGLKTKKEG
jgi:transcriptional regulator with XRE-family HTH domain